MIKCLQNSNSLSCLYITPPWSLVPITKAYLLAFTYLNASRQFSPYICKYTPLKFWYLVNIHVKMINE